MVAKKVIGYEFNRDFYLDILDRHVLYRGKPLSDPLTAKELEILEFFFMRRDETIHCELIAPLNDVIRSPVQRHPIADYIHKINRKLGLKTNDLFKNVRRFGYRLEANNVRPRYNSDLEEAGDLAATSHMHFNEHTLPSLLATAEHSRKALAINPRGLAELNIELAYSCINLSHVGYCTELPTKGMPEAKAAAEAALAVNPRSARAYGVLGLISLIYEYRWDEAEMLLKKAVGLDPKEASSLLSYAHLLVARGDVEEGLRYMEQAAHVDPTNKLIYSSWGWLCLFAGDLDRANELTKDAIFRFPEFPKAHVMRALVLEEQRQYKDALKEFKRALELEKMIPFPLAGIGHLYGKMGKRRLAHSVLRDLSRLHKEGRTAYVSGYCQALIYAGLGENDLCLAALEKSYDQRCDWLIHLAVEPRWSAIRDEARFKKLMAKIGFQQARSARDWDG